MKDEEQKKTTTLKKGERLTDGALRQLAENFKGPEQGTIRRLVKNVEVARRSEEDLRFQLNDTQWQIVALEADAKLLKESMRHRTQVLVHCDGYIEVFADQGVTLRVVNLLPWQDPHEMMLDEKSHWREIWSAGQVRATALPNFVASPNKIAFDDLLQTTTHWRSSVEVLDHIRALMRELEAKRPDPKATELPAVTEVAADQAG